MLYLEPVWPIERDLGDQHMDEDTTIPKVTKQRKKQIRSDPPANAVSHDEQKQESTKRNKKSPAKGSKRKPETPALPIDQESLEVKEVQKAAIFFFQLHLRLA